MRRGSFNRRSNSDSGTRRISRSNSDSGARRISRSNSVRGGGELVGVGGVGEGAGSTVAPISTAAELGSELRARRRDRDRRGVGNAGSELGHTPRELGKSAGDGPGSEGRGELGGDRGTRNDGGSGRGGCSVGVG